MPLAADSAPILGTRARPLRLVTLVGLRWLAIIGQTAGVIFVNYGLGYPLPLADCLMLIGLSVVLNVLLLLRLGTGARLSSTAATVLLGYDCLQLGGLLALTGGLQNPFSLLLMAPVSVSATTLPQRSTIILAATAIAVASAITVVHLPLPWDPHTTIVFDRVYVTGIWVAIVCGVVFISAYTNRVAHEARQLADALTATELALSRREQLSALDGLAAAAAHELGTPLSTIALAASEMRLELPLGPLRDDIELIIAQSARCRAILAKLRNLKTAELDARDPFATVRLGELLAEVAKPVEGAGKSITIIAADPNAVQPVIGRSVGLLYGLGNIIENAVQFARSAVRIETSCDRGTITVVITDDGPGYAPELLSRLGEPYLTNRTQNNARADSAHGGLGLGIFIAQTLLERTGAKLTFENGAAGGARVRIVWPRRAIEV